jgi:hypothetical protein
MAAVQGGVADQSTQAEIRIAVVDDQGIPLIAETNLPFIDPTKKYAHRIQWNPPTGYFDGLRYGLECALALLRVAPKGGSRRRVDEVSYYGSELMEMQIKRGGPGRGGAYWARWQFWDTMLDFTMQPATAQNVAHYRNAKLISWLQDEVSALRAQQARSRRKVVRP